MLLRHTPSRSCSYPKPAAWRPKYPDSSIAANTSFHCDKTCHSSLIFIVWILGNGGVANRACDIRWSLGSMLFLASWAAMMGPWTYLQHLSSGPRLPFTATYFGSIGLTLYFSLGVSDLSSHRPSDPLRPPFYEKASIPSWTGLSVILASNLIPPRSPADMTMTLAQKLHPHSHLSSHPAHLPRVVPR